MKDSTKGAIFFGLLILFQLITDSFINMLSAGFQIIFMIIWAFLAWTFIYWLFKKINIPKSLRKLDNFYYFRYIGFIIFIWAFAFGVYNLYTSPEAADARFTTFGLAILFGILFIPLFYLIGKILSKVESKSFKYQWIQWGVLFGLIMGLLVLGFSIITIPLEIAGIIKSQESLSESILISVIGTIFAFILFFILGALVSFFFKGASKSADLLDKKAKEKNKR